MTGERSLKMIKSFTVFFYGKTETKDTDIDLLL